MYFECENLSDVYRQVAPVLLKANKVNPRGIETRELIAPHIKINNPRGRLAHAKGRGFNLAFALVESLMLIKPNNEVKYMSAVNKNVEQFSDDGVTFYGSYGRRVADSIATLINKLDSDTHTRQAVLSIYENKDLTVKTKDVPCTLALNFLVRNNELNLVVYMRSNDIIWGLPYDIFSFTVLQELLANTLGLKLGYYIHCPTSLHVYKHHYSMLKLMKQSVNIDYPILCDLYDWSILGNWYMDVVDKLTPGPLHQNISKYGKIIKRKLDDNGR